MAEEFSISNLTEVTTLQNKHLYAGIPTNLLLYMLIWWSLLVWKTWPYRKIALLEERGPPGLLIAKEFDMVRVPLQLPYTQSGWIFMELKNWKPSWEKKHLWLLSCLKLWVTERHNNHSRKVNCLVFRENCRMSNLQAQTSGLSSV